MLYNVHVQQSGVGSYCLDESLVHNVPQPFHTDVELFGIGCFPSVQRNDASKHTTSPIAIDASASASTSSRLCPTDAPPSSALAKTKPRLCRSERLAFGFALGP